MSSLVDTLLCGFLFYALMLIFGWGESRTGSWSGIHFGVAVLGTFVIAWVAYIRRWRGGWQWTIFSAMTFLVVGTFLTWIGSGYSGYWGTSRTFRGLKGLGEAAAWIYGAALIAIIPAGF